MNRKATTLFIFITLALDAIGLGIVIPVLPNIMRRFMSDEGSISRAFGWFIAVYACLQFISSPLLGRLSDRYGRRPVLLIALLGAGIDYLFMAFAPTLPLLFLGRIISGVSGASYTVANAYIADISDDSNRSKNFGVIGAGFGLGFIVGPAIGGLLAGHGLHLPFIAAAVFSFANFLFGLIVLPESLPLSKRRAFDFAALNPFRSLKAMSQVKGVGTLVLVYFLFCLAGQTHPSMWTLYTQHKFGWGPTEVGFSLAIVGVLSALSQGVLTGPIVKRFGELNVIKYGCLGEAVSFALFAFAVSPTMLYIVLIAGSVFWSSQPALQSLITKDVPEDQQGEFQGALISLMAIASIVNPLVMTSLFSFTSDSNESHYLPGSPYLLGSVLLLIAAIATWRKSRSEDLAAKS